MTRRIIKAFRIDEISGVRRPAQEGARAAIIKSAEGPGKEAEMSTNQGSLFKMAHGVDFNKAAIADHLDYLAKARARETGEDYAKAYDGVLETAAGAELYAGYRRAPEGVAAAAAEPPKPPVTKAVAISDALDALAKQRAQQTGETVAAAYLKVLDSEVGRVAYGEMRRSA